MKWLTLITIFLIVGCSPSVKLKRAKRLIAKAVADGARATNDTTYARVNFKAPAMEFSTKLDRFKWGDTLYLKGKDGEAKIITKIIQLPGTHSTDTIVKVECPEQDVTADAPIANNQTIEAGYTTWQMIWNGALWFLIGVVVGFALYFLLRVVLKLF